MERPRCARAWRSMPRSSSRSEHGARRSGADAITILLDGGDERVLRDRIVRLDVGMPDANVRATYARDAVERVGDGTNAVVTGHPVDLEAHGLHLRTMTRCATVSKASTKRAGACSVATYARPAAPSAAAA